MDSHQYVIPLNSLDYLCFLVSIEYDCWIMSLMVKSFSCFLSRRELVLCIIILMNSVETLLTIHNHEYFNC